MALVQNEIDSKLEDFEFTKLNHLESEKIQNEISERFGTNNSYTYPLWENLEDKLSIYNRDGWKLISDYIKGRSVFLVLEQLDDKAAYFFENGEEVVSLLGECFGFVFYVTDVGKSFLLCFNDHDHLIGSGLAKEWIKTLN